MDLSIAKAIIVKGAGNRGKTTLIFEFIKNILNDGGEIIMPNHYTKSEIINKNKPSDYCMIIKYKGKKYSVPTYLIGKSVTVKETEEYIHIYYTTNLVRKHKKDEKFLNYNKDDMIDILKSDALKGLEDEEIETFIENNLDNYDNL